MFSWTAWTVFAAGGLLLLVAGVGHVLRRRHLAVVLTTHRLPTRARRIIAATLGFTEIVVGAAVVVTALTGATAALAGALGALFYAAFTVYLVRLLRIAPGADCGCFGADEPVSVWTAGRAGLLAVAAALTTAVPSPAGNLGQGAGLVGAGVLVALMLVVVTSVGSMVKHPA